MQKVSFSVSVWVVKAVVAGVLLGIVVLSKIVLDPTMAHENQRAAVLFGFLFWLVVGFLVWITDGITLEDEVRETLACLTGLSWKTGVKPLPPPRDNAQLSMKQFNNRRDRSLF